MKVEPEYFVKLFLPPNNTCNIIIVVLNINSIYMDKMTQDKARKWDGKSRVSNDTYRKRWEEIFKKEKSEEEKNGSTKETNQSTD